MSDQQLPSLTEHREIRIFISSTFRDMVEERDALMSHTWPALRRFCRERQVELVEVDLRWGIAEAQSTRRETLKLCLDEIRACRPYFIGLLGERYGWTPGSEAFTADLLEEQPWLKALQGKSVTELEILHGVLNNPEMAERAFFYLRDPQYIETLPPERRSDYMAEDPASADQQARLKALLRAECAAKKIPLTENYENPARLAEQVLRDLEQAIEAQFPLEEIPDPLTREARDHEAFAETRRRTYIGRPAYFSALDRQASADGGPLALLGHSGSGKSALLANWVQHHRQEAPEDFIFQHYIGSTPDSASHWGLITRLMAEIKNWTKDPEELPRNQEEILSNFPLWLAKARSKAEHEGLRFIIILDALNQLEDRDRALLLGWLPEHPFSGPLRLIVSTLPGEALESLGKRGWQSLKVEPLSVEERRQMIEHYLDRFAKKLDSPRLERIAAASAAANPLYMKIMLDELRVTGTHDRLDENLSEYLAAEDIPTLLKKVLERYLKDYEHERPGLVGEVLGLIWAARRGLTETELLQLLKPAGLPQLPPALWAPLRAALEESLVDRAGLLNFAHDYFRLAVMNAFAPQEERQKALRLQLADYFEAQPVSARSCDELPWLLKEADDLVRLRACLLNIDRFLQIYKRDEEELRRYWVEQLKEVKVMGRAYLESFEAWSGEEGCEDADIAYGANQVSLFLFKSALFAEAEPLMRRALTISEQSYGENHPTVATRLNNLAVLLQDTNRLSEAEPLMRRALKIEEQRYGENHPTVATGLNNLAGLLQDTNRLSEAEPLIRRALKIDEQSHGENHPDVARDSNNLARLLQATNRLSEAEPLMRRALRISEQRYGENHPTVATCLNNLADLLQDTKRFNEAESLMRRALKIDEQSYGENHPAVATHLSNLAQLLQDTNRLSEAEPLIRRALKIDEQSYGENHPDVARDSNNLAGLLKATNRFKEAEPLMRRALTIYEQSHGENHPTVATGLNNLADLLQDTNRLSEAEPLMRRALKIYEQSYGENHPIVATGLSNLAELLQDTNRLSEAESLMRRALKISEQSYGENHPQVARDLNCLAGLLMNTNRFKEAEPLMRRALTIYEQSYGENHPTVATGSTYLAQLLMSTNRFSEAEPLMRRALTISEQSYGENHPDVARDSNNLAGLLKATNRFKEAEPLMRRAIKIYEQSYGINHPTLATGLNNLAGLLQDTNRLSEAEPLMRRVVEIFLDFTRTMGHPHLHLQATLNNYVFLLQTLGQSREQIAETIEALGRQYGVNLGLGDKQAAAETSSRLRKVIEELKQDPSKIKEVAEKLQREDPALFVELIKWLKSQQNH